MGTITMSGFNNIDWNAVLTAVMQQESQPLTLMQTQRTTLQSQSTAFSTLATRLASLESAATDLSGAGTVAGRSVTTTDTSAMSVSADSTALPGTYDVQVTALARAQVTTTTDQTAVAGRDTVVATGGSLVINGKTVSLTGDTTLEQLSAAINGTEGVGVRASIVAADHAYRLVLTGTDTGVERSFTVQNNLAGSTLAFSTTNAVDASDADLTVNNVRVTSTTNTITDAIPGVTLTLFKQTTTPAVVSVGEDASQMKAKLTSFVDAFNDVVSFITAQTTSANQGDLANVGRDPLLRALRSQLDAVVVKSVDVSGPIKNLAEIGIEFQRDGTLKFDTAAFDDRAKAGQADIETLLAGDATAGGTFDAITAAVREYTKAGGLVPDAKDRLTAQMSQLDDRIADMQARLAVRQAALQKEYAAADEAISTLNSQASSLTNLDSAYRLF
jgi:flagellar hook-associated protein 2